MISKEKRDIAFDITLIMVKVLSFLLLGTVLFFPLFFYEGNSILEKGSLFLLLNLFSSLWTSLFIYLPLILISSVLILFIYKFHKPKPLLNVYRMMLVLVPPLIARLHGMELIHYRLFHGYSSINLKVSITVIVLSSCFFLWFSYLGKDYEDKISKLCFYVMLIISCLVNIFFPWSFLPLD